MRSLMKLEWDSPEMLHDNDCFAFLQRCQFKQLLQGCWLKTRFRNTCTGGGGCHHRFLVEACFARIILGKFRSKQVKTRGECRTHVFFQKKWWLRVTRVLMRFEQHVKRAPQENLSPVSYVSIMWMASLCMHHRLLNNSYVQGKKKMIAAMVAPNILSFLRD